MRPRAPDVGQLFDQLGLCADAAAVAGFIRQHAILANGVALHEALSWTPSQAAFLREAIALDGEWAVVVDQLNLALHP